MKKTAAILLTAAMLILCFALSGCGEHSSSYKAVGFVHSNESDSAFMSFYTFEGRMVFRLRCGSKNEGRLRYAGQLEEGSVTVYCECGGEKTLLFSLGDGGDISPSVERIGKGKVYVTVETDGKCSNGDFWFEIE